MLDPNDDIAYLDIAGLEGHIMSAIRTRNGWGVLQAAAYKARCAATAASSAAEAVAKAAWNASPIIFGNTIRSMHTCTTCSMIAPAERCVGSRSISTPRFTLFGLR